MEVLCSNNTGFENCDPEYQSVHLTTGRIVNAAFMVVLMVACLSGNSIMCFLFYRSKRLRVIANYFVISLAFSDLLVGSIAIPLWVSMELTGWANIPHSSVLTMQYIWQSVDIFCCTSSISNLAAVSLERFFGVYKPLQHRSLMNRKVANCFITFVWTYSLFITVLRFITGFQNYLLLVFVVGFALPLLILVCSYFGIYLAVKRRTRRSSNNAELSITKSLFIVTLVFTVCWVPFFVNALMFKYCISCHFIDTPEFTRFLKFSKWLHYSNSAFNPIIYGVCNVNFRNACKDFFRCCFSRKEYLRSQFESTTQDVRSSYLRQSTFDKQCSLQETRKSQQSNKHNSFECNEGVNLIEYSHEIEEKNNEELKNEAVMNLEDMRLSLENLIEKDQMDGCNNNANIKLPSKTLANGHGPDFQKRLLQSQESDL